MRRKLRTRLPVLDRVQTGQGTESEQEGLVAVGLGHVAVTTRDLLALDGAAVKCQQISGDRKSTRLNSSHEWISYAVFCLKKKNCDQYYCVPEYGTANGRHHCHEVHYMPKLHTYSV